MLSNDEKEYLKMLVKREIQRFKKEGVAASGDAAVKFLKAEHEYGHFLDKLLENLK